MDSSLLIVAFVLVTLAAAVVWRRRVDAAATGPDGPLECDLTEADDDADGSYGLYWYLACRLDDVVSVRNFCGMV